MSVMTVYYKLFILNKYTSLHTRADNPGTEENNSHT